MTDVLVKRGDVETDTPTEGAPCEEGRDQGDASTSQGKSTATSKPPEARREAWRLSLRALRKNQPYRPLDLGLQPPEP